MKKTVSLILALLMKAAEAGMSPKDFVDGVASEAEKTVGNIFDSAETVIGEAFDDAETALGGVIDSAADKAEQAITDVMENAETFASVEEYIKAYPDLLEDVAQAYGDAMDISISARGNLMVFSIASDLFDFIYEYGETMEGIKEYFDPIIDGMANSLGLAVIDGKKEVPSLQGIAIEYSDSKGNLLYSRIITEEDAYKDYGDGSDVDISSFDGEMTVEQWIESLSNQNLGTDVGVLNVYADGNVIVYVNTFDEGVTLYDIDVQMLKTYHAEMTETATEAKKLIKMQVPDLEGIRYEYVLADGTVVYSHQY